MKNKACLIGYYGAGNLGDELLLLATEELLYKCGWSVNFIIGFFPGSSKEVNKKNIIGILKAIFSSDALVFGGGSVLQDKSSILSLLYYCLVAIVFKLFGKKLIFLAQGLGPFQSDFSVIIAMFILGLADFVSVRDVDSQKFLCGKKINSILTQDLVFSLSAFPPLKSEQEKKTILISLRNDQLSASSFNQLLEQLKILAVKYSFKLFALQREDVEILQRVKEEFPKSQIYEIYNPETLKHNWSEMLKDIEFALCMRLHAAIICLKAGLPVIGLAYDPKVKSLCEAFSQPYLNLENDISSLIEKTKILKSPQSLGDLHEKIFSDHEKPLRELIEDS
jgi:polysaccharide pyruvyl transferase CsaB